MSIVRLTEFLFLEELDSENVAKNMPEHSECKQSLECYSNKGRER